jgi:hypothetical protein
MKIIAASVVSLLLLLEVATVLNAEPLLQATMPSRSREVIRDRQGHKLGEVVRLSNGKQEARDPFGRKLGTYDPKSDQTRDPLGRLLTKGNTLSALIVKATEAEEAKSRQKNR